ncbi:MAG TPA: acyl-CoA dehydrogenase family protein [Solirubrobacteraceae bacterium]|jgi:acyl-CoA dehydrogenase|nr:acyl-CoA dehydrogenase family protein [Solirubrobacteraceae bacterium]
MTNPDPPFTHEHEELRESIRGFIDRELAPHAQQWEDERWFPDEVFPRLAAQGLLGLKYPTALGGQGGDHLHEAVMCEELARIGSGGTAAGIGAHVNIATPPIWKFGTDEQKQRYLVPAIRGEKIGALGITEPGAGSDVAGLRSKAERVDGGWVVNGEKTYITNGVRAHFIVTAARTTPEGGQPDDSGGAQSGEAGRRARDRHEGISFFIVDRGEGVSSSKLQKLGWHASDTATIAYQDVFVPEQNLLGELHGGFKLIMANFQWERLAMALGAIGAMRLAWERTAQFARERQAFGRPLSDHQAIRHKLADLAASAYQARCVTYDALRRFVAGEEPLREVTMAKLLTQRACFELMDACLQIHGGAGYMREVWVERAARDARLGPIGGGSDEIMREILGRVLGF